jgi:hypothetical protein
MAAYVTAGVGVVLLVIVVLVAMGHVRRFDRARVTMRTDTRRRTLELKALVHARPRRTE